MNKNQLTSIASCIRKLAKALDESEADIIECLSGSVISEEEAGDIKEALKDTPA
jgi:hypothetical protein